jgi:hypothetical protein
LVLFLYMFSEPLHLVFFLFFFFFFFFPFLLMQFFDLQWIEP